MSNQIQLTDDYTSSLISSDAYDEPTQTIAIRFRSTGDVWHYGGCSPAMWEAYNAAESKGKYFHGTIKKNLQGVKQ